jgi:hypothetical protein
MAFILMAMTETTKKRFTFTRGGGVRGSESYSVSEKATLNLRSSGMFPSADWYLLIDVSKLSIGPNSKSQQSRILTLEDGTDSMPENVDYCQYPLRNIPEE